MRRPRDSLLLAAAGTTAIVLVAAAVGAVEWIGRPFPGFLVLENRVVASAGIARWPATEGGTIYQHEIVAVNGERLSDVRRLHELVASQPPGTPVRYRFRKGDREFERSIATRRFEAIDFALVFGSFLLNGIAFAGTGLLVRFLRGRDQLASGSVPILWFAGIWAITAVDLYGPYHLFRVHAFCETLLFAGTLHKALVFPHPSRVLTRHPRAVWIPYALALSLAAVNQLGLFHATTYVVTHLIATSAFGTSLAVYIASQLRWFLRPPNFEARQRVKVVAFGAVAALTPPVIIALGSGLTGGSTPQNAMAFSTFLFPLAIGYAVLRHNLLEVDVFVRRSLSYALLTSMVTLVYVGAVQLFGASLEPSQARSATPAGVIATVLCVFLLLPLRDRMQTAIDRLFFRSAWDFRRIVETASARLASTADLHAIAGEIAWAVGETLHPVRATLYVRRPGEAAFETIGSGLDPELEACDRIAIGLAGAGPIDTAERGLCIPFRAEGELVAAFVVGPRRSGGIYGGDDRRLLHTLSNQGAVAVKNALALEQLRALARDLEAKVEERSSELRRAHAQLVHREKMASIGQFVAGIAHELNNPLNFIQGNLHCLREYVDAVIEVMRSYQEVAGGRDPGLCEQLEAIRREHGFDQILADVESAFDGCGEGVERSTTLVRDLRTFSRLDQPERLPVDLRRAVESTLNLLRSKLTGIEVVRDFGDVPPVEGLAGQLEQVFMNLIANAADAEPGRIAVRTRPLGGDRVEVEIQDDGSGISPEHLERIFDPFFTTKEVGKGTGLGLAISYGIVTRHGGGISVESQADRGTRFRIVLPVHARESPQD